MIGHSRPSLFKFRHKVSIYRKSLIIKPVWVVTDTAKTESRVAALECSESREYEFNLLIVVAMNIYMGMVK